MACIQGDCSCKAETVAFQPLPAFTAETGPSLSIQRSTIVAAEVNPEQQQQKEITAEIFAQQL